MRSFLYNLQLGTRHHPPFTCTRRRSLAGLFLERFDNLRLRRASVFAKQPLLPSAPDLFVALGHRNGDGVGIYAVGNHLGVRYNLQDGILRRVELLPTSVSVGACV